LRIDDNRTAADHHEYACSTQLWTEQTVTVQQLIEQETSVLIARPGTGKTVIARAAIASRATSTLILVDRKALADQWRDRLQKHLGFKCGQIGGGRSKTTGILDVALLPTLARRASVEDITAKLRIRDCRSMPPRRRQRILPRPQPNSGQVLAETHRDTGTPRWARRSHLPPTRITPHHP
jgi:superfamily II DNA or RNA helicase